MHPLFLRTAAVGLLLLGSLGACDRHPAGEASEAYGHGSSHSKSYRSHSIDSRQESQSFSDTAGIDQGAKEKAGEPK